MVLTKRVHLASINISDGDKEDRTENKSTDVQIEFPEDCVLPEKKDLELTRKRPTLWLNIKDYFREYTSATSLHGFQYLGDRNRSVFERICWFLLISTSFCICLLLIKKTYDKWNLTPVIVTFAHSPTPVWNIPFPAVTMCSEIKARQAVYNFTKYYKEFQRNQSNITDTDLKQLTDAALLCEPSFALVKGNLTTDDDALLFMERMAPEMKDIVLGCESPSLGSKCGNIFDAVLTEEGICYSFNLLGRSDIYADEVYHINKSVQRKQNGWSLEDGYENWEDVNNTYPKRTVSAGAQGGLTIYLRANADDIDVLCRGPTQGFKIVLHDPGEMPRVTMQYLRVPFNEEITLAVKPDMMKTSSALRNYDPHKRGCYFPMERKLRYYKHYTQLNCFEECVANNTLKRCGCVAFYRPRQNTTAICGIGSQTCIRKAEEEILSGERMEDFKEDTVIDCDCLPSCTTLSYSAETSQTVYDWKNFVRAFQDDDSDLSKFRISKVNIFFKEMHFMPSERHELYGLTDFLANCGGLLGLFMGFSLLSLVETLYFLSARLVINLKRYGRHYWSGSDRV